jgi:hypothetical protein
VELLNGGSGVAFRSCLQTYVGLNPKKKNKVRSASLSAHPNARIAFAAFALLTAFRRATQKSARLGASATTAGVYETFYVSIKVTGTPSLAIDRALVLSCCCSFADTHVN